MAGRLASLPSSRPDRGAGSKAHAPSRLPNSAGSVREGKCLVDIHRHPHRLGILAPSGLPRARRFRWRSAMDVPVLGRGFSTRTATSSMVAVCICSGSLCARLLCFGVHRKACCGSGVARTKSRCLVLVGELAHLCRHYCGPRSDCLGCPSVARLGPTHALMRTGCSSSAIGRQARRAGGRGRLRGGVDERRERLRSRASESGQGPATGPPVA